MATHVAPILGANVYDRGVMVGHPYDAFNCPCPELVVALLIQERAIFSQVPFSLEVAFSQLQFLFVSVRD
jgi:hypothetical protein